MALLESDELEEQQRAAVFDRLLTLVLPPIIAYTLSRSPIVRKTGFV